MGVIHDELGESGPRQSLDLPFDERLSAGDEQRLGQRIGERAKALAAPRGQDQRVAHQNV